MKITYIENPQQMLVPFPSPTDVLRNARQTTALPDDSPELGPFSVLN